MKSLQCTELPLFCYFEVTSNALVPALLTQCTEFLLFCKFSARAPRPVPSHRKIKNTHNIREDKAK